MDARISSLEGSLGDVLSSIREMSPRSQKDAPVNPRRFSLGPAGFSRIDADRGTDESGGVLSAKRRISDRRFPEKRFSLM